MASIDDALKELRLCKQAFQPIPDANGGQQGPPAATPEGAPAAPDPMQGAPAPDPSQAAAMQAQQAAQAQGGDPSQGQPQPGGDPSQQAQAQGGPSQGGDPSQQAQAQGGDPAQGQAGGQDVNNVLMQLNDGMGQMATAVETMQKQMGTQDGKNQKMMEQFAELKARFDVMEKAVKASAGFEGAAPVQQPIPAQPQAMDPSMQQPIM